MCALWKSRALGNLALNDDNRKEIAREGGSNIAAVVKDGDLDDAVVETSDDDM